MADALPESRCGGRDVLLHVNLADRRTDILVRHVEDRRAVMEQR
jgi:hypothetical protein